MPWGYSVYRLFFKCIPDHSKEQTFGLWQENVMNNLTVPRGCSVSRVFFRCISHHYNQRTFGLWQKNLPIFLSLEWSVFLVPLFYSGNFCIVKILSVMGNMSTPMYFQWQFFTIPTLIYPTPLVLSQSQDNRNCVFKIKDRTCQY